MGVRGEGRAGRAREGEPRLVTQAMHGIELRKQMLEQEAKKAARKHIERERAAREEHQERRHAARLPLKSASLRVSELWPWGVSHQDVFGKAPNICFLVG